MSPGFAERLKIETRGLHTAAERSGFMHLLLRGLMPQPAYCALLRNLHAIYAALEPALARHKAHPLIAPVFAPALCRAAALERDLAALHGPRWSDDIALQPAARAYVARLHEIEASRAGLLLAHAYVRYLGDLSGGQALSRVVAASVGSPGNRGVAFYDFGDASATKELTKAFRDGLADVPVDAMQSDALVDEARLAFGLHRLLFDELASRFGID